MKLVAYADESGTHSGPGSDVLTVAGWVAPSEEWIKFCQAWQRVLNHYSAPYFHFREWAMASAVARKRRRPSSDFGKNPYASWNQSRLDDFLFKLAEVAASGNKLPVGGYVPANLLRNEQRSGTSPTAETPHELCVRHFFDSVRTTIYRERAPWKRLPIALFFDQSEDVRWKQLIRDTFDASRKKSPQFKALEFGDKKDHLPLQAADMVAYRTRQSIELNVNFDFSSRRWPELDGILFRSFNDSYEKMSQHERDAMLMRFFKITTKEAES